MKIIKFSSIISSLENKDNKYLDICGVNTSEIEIDMDFNKVDNKYNLCYIIASVISNDHSILNFVNIEILSKRNISELNKLSEFLKISKSGMILCESIRKDLLQFEIITNYENYQIEIHLGNQNFCVCKNFDVIAIDAYK